MANYNDFFRSKDFLSAADLQGRDVVVRIRQVIPETVQGDDGPETALCAYFDNKTKKLRLNRTNADSIAAVANTQDHELWAGVSLTLFPTKVPFRGEMKDTIRIRPAPSAAMQTPAPVAPPPPPPPTAISDDIPF